MILSPNDAVRIYSKYISNMRVSSVGRVRICSPFREERVGSFEINLNNGLWYDYGSGEGGDIINFISRLENLSIKESLDRYAEVMNGGSVSGIEAKGGIKYVNESSGNSLQVYRRDYLEDIHRWDGSILEGRGIDEGTFREYGGYMWRLKGRDYVLIDYRGEGLVDRYKLFVYSGGRKKVYTRGSSTLYPLSSLRGKNIVLCEGEYDALSLLSGGVNAITGSAGAGTFREEWVWALSKKGVYVIYDNDGAGESGSNQVSSMLSKWVRSIKVHKWINKPLHYDVGDYIKEGGAVNELIKESRFYNQC